MLSYTSLRNLKPQDKTYKVADRDGMYVTVSPKGTIAFRLDYRLNGWRETLTIGRYGSGGISLALARERCLEAKRAVAKGRSPSLEKQRDAVLGEYLVLIPLRSGQVFGPMADANSRKGESS